MTMDFYPRPPRGGRHAPRHYPSTTYQFLSTPSARRATVVDAAGICTFLFLSTPSARRATSSKQYFLSVERISIHALREEGDGVFFGTIGRAAISIHALREEGDLSPSVTSTRILYFYPRPPRGGRQ